MVREDGVPGKTSRDTPGSSRLMRESGTAWADGINRAGRKAFVPHPPEEPLLHSALMRSFDEVVTWSAPEVVPSKGFHCTECAGLTKGRNGRVLLNQWRFRWLPFGVASRYPSTAERHGQPVAPLASAAACRR